MYFSFILQNMMNSPPLPGIPEPTRGMLGPKLSFRKRSFRYRKMRKDTEKDLDNLTDAYMEEWAGEIIFLVLVFYSMLFFDLAY